MWNIQQNLINYLIAVLYINAAEEESEEQESETNAEAEAEAVAEGRH